MDGCEDERRCCAPSRETMPAFVVAQLTSVVVVGADEGCDVSAEHHAAVSLPGTTPLP